MKTKNQSVYLVQHSRDLDNGAEDVKIIGVFSTEGRAKTAVRLVEKAPGFRKYTAGFHIDRYPLDQEFWSEGFSSEANLDESKTLVKRRRRKP